MYQLLIELYNIYRTTINTTIFVLREKSPLPLLITFLLSVVLYSFVSVRTPKY